MALADRILTVLAGMDGQEYGKQSRLARHAGCGRSIVNHWLSGAQKEIAFEHAQNIANDLSYRVEWVMQGKGPKKKGDTAKPEPDSEKFLADVTVEEMRLITRYRGATAVGRALIEMACQGASQPT